ncbi:MAG: Periplasmic murein peptide-binding protein [Paracidovorax wautersii]|uniref:Periplasmic murein peptide-binding protein n=1 Tax=Paracidovorax wautersii TaxID=1177982 RepID=A0A7V8FKM9_9BURK|nr:MAG: Periplasmic murein peptide-binding protein [Paracidovorax wautersii]
MARGPGLARVVHNARMRVFLWTLLMACASPAGAASAYGMWDEPRYRPGFDHFGYVDPAAPKGGELRLVSNLRYSTFDKYNPFTIKGSAPAYLSDLMFDSLLTGSLDESGVGYGLLAEDVAVAPDRLSVTFRLRPQARFHNGDPVLAQDVKYTFDTLMGPYTSPAYKTVLRDVAGLDVVDAHTVRFRFKAPNRELPLTVGGLPIFSHRWGEGKRFDQVVTDVPIGSGPYKIGPVVYGRDITYVRDPGYWARDLNVRKGTANFDRITVRIYRDTTARMEALKAGQFDLMRFSVARDWARSLNGKRFATGELVKGEFEHRQPTGFQSYVLNTRRDLLKDERVRRALGLAMDFEWMNRQLFYSSYQRVNGLFGNTQCQTEGEPGPGEWSLLERWRGQISDAAFGPMTVPPRTDGDQSLRDNLRLAQDLLKQAGWTVRDGALRNAQGTPMVLEYLDSTESSGQRIMTPWQRNLSKLGIRLNYREVDFALYLQRLSKFEFDVVSINFQGTINPGQEFFELFGSQAADQEDSGNLAGVKSPAVDDLIAHMVKANTKRQLQDACHALDRVIAHRYYLIPQWSAPTYRMVYNDWRLQRPAGEMPPYAPGEAWAIWTWWARPVAGPAASH